jgi:hypothetical protein
MRKFMTACALFGALSGLALAENWEGTLLDANCARSHKSKACDAKHTSTAFLLDVNGTRYTLDNRSNDETRSAMQSRSDRASNPEATKAVPVHAKITGVMRNGKIRASVVEVQ